MTGAGSFDDYLASLSPFVPAVGGTEPESLSLCTRATAAVRGLDPLDRGNLADVIAADPYIAPVLAAVVGLSQERFRTWLKERFQTAGWVTLGRTSSADLVGALDEDFDLIALLEAQVQRTWTWADALARVMAPRQLAGGSVRQGRVLEDAVEEKVKALGVPYVARTRFVGKADRTAPADFAIPNGEDALIAVAVKNHDSTGSKLSAAVGEIQEMVDAKTPRQYIFAVVDGQGWQRRAQDLRRIHGLWTANLIDGMYTRGQLDALGLALEQVVTRLGLRWA